VSELDASRARILAGVALCERELDERNLTATGDLARTLEGIRGLAGGERRARVAVLGRRGAGKSSLLNALAGAPLADVGDVSDATGIVTWHALTLSGRTLRWGDTPGLRAGGQPTRRELLIEALSLEPPDLLIVLCHASEVDAAVDADLEDVAAIRSALGRVPGRHTPPPLLALITRTDELAPPDVVDVPLADREKRDNIRESVSVFGRHLLRVGLAPRGIVPVSTYVRFERGRIAVDRRWNVDVVAKRLLEHLPSDERLNGPIVAEELRATIDHAMRAVTDVFATRANEAAGELRAEPVALRAELATLHHALVRVLVAMSPQRETPEPGWLDAVAGPEGALEGVRALLRWLRAGKASGAVAGLQLRAAGTSVRRALLG
jgi:predicted GTPase